MTAAATSPPIAIVGAGIVGCAVTWALAAEGHEVLLLDRAEPGTGGASFGNVGHIATEQVEPLPSRQLLLGFWRELFAFDGPLDIPLLRLPALSPWMARFAGAAFRQQSNTRHLAPLVRRAADSLQTYLQAIVRPDLIRRQGHYCVWFGPEAQKSAAREAAHSARLQVRTLPAPAQITNLVAAKANETSVAALWFPDSAHVLDPAKVAQALANAAIRRGATFLRASVQLLEPRNDHIDIVTEMQRIRVNTVIVCAGAWSPPLLTPFGLRAPIEAERGYHVELPEHAPLVDAPLLYADQKVVVTPMVGRLRCTGYLEMAGLDAPPDPRKPTRLRAKLRQLGYHSEPQGPSWMGPRPTLPDYLPGIGCLAQDGYRLLYAVGHQHLGLTLAAPTAELIADLIARRPPRVDIGAFDLRRFGGTAARSA